MSNKSIRHLFPWLFLAFIVLVVCSVIFELKLDDPKGEKNIV